MPLRITPLNHGLVNKGNTCHSNAILQAISVLPNFWQRLTAESSDPSPLITAILSTIVNLRSSRTHVDPSLFLNSLQTVIRNAGAANFEINAQQDAADVLRYILNEVAPSAITASESLLGRCLTIRTCSGCLSFQSTEDNFFMMAIPMSTSIQNSVNTILSSTTVDGNTCCLDSEMVSEQRFSHCGQYLILHLSRFASIDGVPIKDTRRVDACADKLVVSVAVDDEVFLPCHYKLLSVINHSGTLNRGHYTAYVREPSGCWWFCNDKAVIPASVQNLSNSDSYLFFYGRVAN